MSFIYLVIGNIISAFLGLLVLAILLIAGMAAGMAVGWGLLTFLFLFAVSVVALFTNPLKIG